MVTSAPSVTVAELSSFDEHAATDQAGGQDSCDHSSMCATGHPCPRFGIADTVVACVSSRAVGPRIVTSTRCRTSALRATVRPVRHTAGRMMSARIRRRTSIGANDADIALVASCSASAVVRSMGGRDRDEFARRADVAHQPVVGVEADAEAARAGTDRPDDRRRSARHRSARCRSGPSRGGSGDRARTGRAVREAGRSARAVGSTRLVSDRNLTPWPMRWAP